MSSISLILLAGGLGRRLKSSLPKQFLDLSGQLVIERALNSFLGIKEFSQIILVCSLQYKEHINPSLLQKVTWANPGLRRQDSLENGLKELKEKSSLVFVHDAARPFFDPKYFYPLKETALKHGASVLGCRISSTLKKVDSNQRVTHTLERDYIWEAQTPQVAFRDDLMQGLEVARKEKIEVTDEASLLQLVGKQIQMVEGDNLNLKITRPEDLRLAQLIATHKERDETPLFT